MSAISRVLAYHEWMKEIGAYAIPQFAVLASTAKGDAFGLPPPMEPQTSDGHMNSARALSAKFAHDDVVILRGVLPAYVASVARDYYADTFGRCYADPPAPAAPTGVKCLQHPEVTEDMFPISPDGFVHSISSERLGFFLNQYLKPVVEAAAGKQLKVSYSYFVQYRGLPDNPGLLPHVDMIDNEYTMTIAIDWTPESRGAVPIYVQRRREAHTFERGHNVPPPAPDEPVEEVLLSRGDGMLFRGRSHPHFRSPMIVGQSCSNLLVHFVDKDFPLDLTREEHNRKVCCAWPPTPESGFEDCPCMDPQLAEQKQNAKLADSATKQESTRTTTYRR